MSQTLIVLDRQAIGRIFPFGTTSSGGDALVTVNKGSAALSTVVLDVKASANIAGDLNLIGNLNITGSVNETSTTNLLVTDLTITTNRGGSTPSDDTSGLKVEGTSATVVGALFFNAASATKWSIGDGTTQVDIVGRTSPQTLTNKSISGGQITSAVANATLAANVTTNANLTGVITSVGNATSIGSQTGTGTVFVTQVSPTLTTPNIGVATGTSISTSGAHTTGTASTTDGIITFQNAVNAFTQSFKGSNPGASITYVLPTTAPTAGQVLSSTAPSAGVATTSWASPGAGTVTTVSVVTANGVSGSVANPTTTPAITISLAAITPTTIVASGAISGSNLSGTNTGDQTTVSGNSGSTTLTAITDDTTTNATEYITWVGTASGNQAQKVSSTKLTFNPSTGTLTATVFSGAGTSLTGTGASFTAGNVTTNANLTGMVTSVGNATTVVTNANLTGDVTSVGNATTLAKFFKADAVTGTQDGSNKVFSIATAVSANSEMIFVNGQLLTPGSSNDYVISSTTVTFQAAFTAPAATDVIRAYGVY